MLHQRGSWCKSKNNAPIGYRRRSPRPTVTLAGIPASGSTPRSAGPRRAGPSPGGARTPRASTGSSWRCRRRDGRTGRRSGGAAPRGRAVPPHVRCGRRRRRPSGRATGRGGTRRRARSRGHPTPGGVPRPVRPPALAALDRLPPPLPLAAEVGAPQLQTLLVPLPQPDPSAPMPAFFLTMVSKKSGMYCTYSYVELLAIGGIGYQRFHNEPQKRHITLPGN